MYRHVSHVLDRKLSVRSQVPPRLLVCVIVRASGHRRTTETISILPP